MVGVGPTRRTAAHVDDADARGDPINPREPRSPMTLAVHLVQPIVPAYRVPVFRALAASKGVDLTVWADVRTTTGSLKGIASDSGFRIRPAPLRWLGPFCWQGRSIDAAREADVLILGWSSRSLDLPISLRRARRRGAGTVLWGHGFGTSLPMIGDWRRRRAMRSADAFLLYGPVGRDRLAAAGFPRERLFIAPNAVDQTAIAAAAAPWRRDPALQAAFRRERSLGDDPILLYLARLEEEKRPDLAIEALAILRRTRPARLAFIGDGAMRPALEALARERGLAEAVIFLGPIYDEPSIAPWATTAACLVHPGAIGLSIFHAFGYGLPVVTSDRREIQMPEFETHRDGENGLLFRHGDAADLAARIESLLADESRRRLMVDAAVATVSGPRGRNIEGMVSGFLEAIDLAASRHGRTRT